jgi:hypothetical protein
LRHSRSLAMSLFAIPRAVMPPRARGWVGWFDANDAGRVTDEWGV